jgi:histidyl-tRNA synthetase
VNKGFNAETLAMDLSRKLRNFDLKTELDVSGASFSKQFKKANKIKSKSIIVIGDDEASKREFVIRLFNNEISEDQQETISIEDNIKLEKWLKSNLLLDLKL